ncbi:SAM-dependent chlorinase/fluorinase [Micromonospora sp. NBC_00330]|uniref:SAM hydrolase/SAM-dependent halogenase family protein n=1 Tax=Micromonospora sp. NBC_00330 TaxID=2903585 RepID=UPI002E28E0EB|nr:SAM-dependent chlorinase/fluorinase [Micromonospora sp. NBC_00330]
MSAVPWISLTTDYGLTDGFVAACHGVVARIAPAARVIDVTHLVPPADVRRGAAVLAQTVPYLPVGVHVAVVDPGVGTARRGVALATPGGLVRLPTPTVTRDAEGFTAEVLTVDHFGNVQLAAPAELLDPLPATLRVGPPGPGPALVAVHGRTFGDAPAGGLVAYVDSAGLVAVAVNGGRAADRLAASPGDLLRVSG